VSLQGTKDEKKIICSNENASIKIEPNYTIRGSLLPPVHELLDCTVKNNSYIYEKEFRGMTDSPISYDELLSVLQKLKLELKKNIIQYKNCFLTLFH